MKPFSPESDQVIANAFDWLGKRQLASPEPIIPFRFYRPGMAFSESDAKMLREMAKSAVWVEQGGKAYGARTTSDQYRGIKSREEMNTRSQWLGMPEWARGFGMNREEITAVVEKALKGESLGRKQALLIQSMLEVVAQVNATVIPF